MGNNPFKLMGTDETSARGSLRGSHVRTWNDWGRGIIFGLTVLAIGLILRNSVAEAIPHVEAPEFEVVTLDGEPYSKASLRGQPTLLVFWAPWCHFCQRELPLLARFYQESKPEQLRILTIAFADTRANVEAYVESNPDTFVFPTAYDEDNRVAQTFGVNATPTFVVMNAQGDLILAHRGAGLRRNPQYQAFLGSLKS